MKNCIPKELTIAKSVKVFKQMNRGSIKCHVNQYCLNDEMRKAGLVCWKDRDIVYFCQMSVIQSTLVNVHDSQRTD